MAACAQPSTCNPELEHGDAKGENIMATASLKKHSAKAGNAVPAEVGEYFAGVPEPARSTLHQMRAAIRSAVPPDATEAISYNIPAFKYNGPLLFPAAVVIAAFKNELKGYRTSKGTIHFPLDKPLPTTLLKKFSKGASSAAATEETQLMGSSYPAILECSAPPASAASSRRA
jgi:uncharacterized protein YdhG (YjbR/CyaY superfamily)